METHANSRIDNAFVHGSAVVFGFSALACLAFLPILISGDLLVPNDGTAFFYPSFHSRHWLWSPDIFAGFPTHVDPQQQTWYLPALLFAKLPGGWNAFVLSPFILGASLTYAYVYHNTRSKIAAAVAGAAFGFGGYMFVRVRHITFIHTMQWVPLLLLGFDRLAQTPNTRWLALSAVACALVILAGHPQVAFYALVISTLYVLVAAARSRKAALWSLGALALGVALCGIQLIPTAHHLPTSVRSELTPQTYLANALPPRRLLMAMTPYIGNSSAPESSRGETLRLPPERSYHTGVVATLCALLSLASGIHRRRILFWLGVAVTSALLAMGEFTPLGAWSFYIPGINRFRIPARHLFELSIAIPMLSGFGVAAIEARTLRLPPYALQLVVGVATVCTGALCWSAAPSLKTQTLAVATALLCGGALVVCAWLSRPTARLATLLVVFAVAELLLFAQHCEWRSLADSNTQRRFELPAAAVGTVMPLLERRQRILSTDGMLGSRSTLPPNRSELWGIPNAGGYNPLVSRKYATFTGLAFTGSVYSGAHRQELFADHNMVLDLLAVRYIFLPTSKAGADATRMRFTTHMQIGETTVFENPRALPRMWLASQTEVLSYDDILQSVRTSRLPDGTGFSPLKTALVEDSEAWIPEVTGKPAWQCAVELNEDTALRIRIASDSNGFLVMSDAYSPGWKATLDGKSIPIYPVFTCLRGVPIPEGESVLELHYAPAPLFWGAALTILALASLAALLIVAGVRRSAGGSVHQ